MVLVECFLVHQSTRENFKGSHIVVIKRHQHLSLHLHQPEDEETKAGYRNEWYEHPIHAGCGIHVGLPISSHVVQAVVHPDEVHCLAEDVDGVGLLIFKRLKPGDAHDTDDDYKHGRENLYVRRNTGKKFTGKYYQRFSQHNDHLPVVEFFVDSRNQEPISILESVDFQLFQFGCRILFGDISNCLLIASQHTEEEDRKANDPNNHGWNRDPRDETFVLAFPAYYF